MTKRIDELPVVLTCFAYREDYFSELDGMLATLREHHPGWTIVAGKGPVEGFELPTLEVESPSGKRHWSLPVSLNLDGNAENNWRKIVMMKAWWIAQVWHNFDELADFQPRRIVWIDADARLGGPLDIELDPEAEVLAGPWWYDAEHPAYEGVRGGILLFQGRQQGKVESLMDQWSDKCLAYIQSLPPRVLPWPESDQEALNELLRGFPDTTAEGVFLKLEHSKYCGHLTKYGASRPGTLLIHWLMSAKMWLPEDSNMPWPPTEEYRRQVAAESGFPSKPQDALPDESG